MLRKKINSHKLLQGASPTLSYEVLRRVRTQANELLAGSDPQTSTFLRNLCALSHKEIFDLYALYGEEGLFNLSLLMYSKDFDWFYPLIVFDLECESRTQETYLSLDNAAISVHPKVKTFQTNVFRPALARKIFRPGTHHGFICYGLAGPRILVSHPFQGNAKEIETYDIYRNSADVVLRLMERGYRGTFLFLDYLAGLNEEIEGVPAWSLWFSFLATQADLVVYIKEYEGDFGYAQQLELAYVSDYTQKKIEEIPSTALTWAKKEVTQAKEIIYMGENGPLTKEEFYAFEASFAKPFIEEFVHPDIPLEPFIQVTEEGEVHLFPLDFDLY